MILTQERWCDRRRRATRGSSSSGYSRTATEGNPDDKLSDIQLTILSAAAQRRDGNLLPPPGALRGAAAKVVAARLSHG